MVAYIGLFRPVFPARAGINRIWARILGVSLCVPRASGDKPLYTQADTPQL